MPPMVDLANQRFSKLVAITCVGRSRAGKALWKCQCDCGREVTVISNALRTGNTKSCGQCPNKAEHLQNGTTVITLERKNGDTLPCIVDTADYPLVKAYRWWASSTNSTHIYAAAKIPKGGKLVNVQMHSLLLPGIPLIDHRNGDGLCNVRSNLRPASSQQNAANRRKHRIGTSKYRGVCWDKKSNKFRATICVNYKPIVLGWFDSELDASHKFDKAAKKYFGEFASLNHNPVPPNVHVESSFTPALVVAQPLHAPIQTHMTL